VKNDALHLPFVMAPSVVVNVDRQYAFTKEWLGAETKLLMRRFAPERLVVDMMRSNKE